jgi:hypothetical protein
MLLPWSNIAKEFERKTQPPMSVEAARKIIETETRAQEAKHWKVWGLYKDHRKALETLIANEPAKPKVFGITKWQIEHGKWESERDRLLESLNYDLESLCVKHTTDGANIDKAHKEAVTRHERFKQYAAAEALQLHPDAAAIIREDDMKRESEELARREAEEARMRIEKENYRRFRLSIQELATKFGEEAFIVTNAQDGRNYSGLIMGTVENSSHCYAAQMIGENHVILHDIEKDDLSQIAAIVGKKVEIKSLDGRIGVIAEELGRQERSRGWSR